MAKRAWMEAQDCAEDDTVPSSTNLTRRREASNGAPAPKTGSQHSASWATHTDSAAGVDQPVPQVSRKIKACAACRRHKIKCLMDERGPPCRRCAERDLGCVLGKNLQSIIDEKSQYSEAVVQDLENMHAALREIVRKANLPELPPLQSASLRDAQGSPTADGPAPRIGKERRAQDQEDQLGPSCDNSPRISPEDEGLPYVPIQSLYALTKLRALRSPEATQSQGAHADDFISRGAISLGDVERLFALYRDRLDAFMYGVGCRYQTLHELRKRSTILAAATLTVAALHDSQANDIYGVLSSEFRQLMERSMFDRRVDRDYLRALAVASYWLSDMSWMLSGYAIRRAAEYNLHNSHNRVMTEQSEEAADSARRPLSNDEDKRLASQVALLGILRSVRDLFGPDKGEPMPRVYLNQIAHFNRQLDQWIGHWSSTLSDHHHHIGAFPRKGALLHFHFAKLHLYSHVFRGLPRDVPLPHYFLDCALTAIAAATSIIDFIRTDPDVSASIVGIPSYLHSMTAFACMFLIKVAVKYGGELVERERVYGMITSLVQHFRSLSTGKWHLAPLMAGGLEKMAATLHLAMENQQSHFRQGPLNMRQGMNLGMDAVQQMPDIEGQLLGLESDLFLDYGTTFGLSPVFRFEPPTLDVNGPTAQLQGFADVDFHTRPRS